MEPTSDVRQLSWALLYPPNGRRSAIISCTIIQQNLGPFSLSEDSSSFRREDRVSFCRKIHPRHSVSEVGEGIPMWRWDPFGRGTRGGDRAKPERDRTTLPLPLYSQQSFLSSVSLSWVISGLVCKTEMSSGNKIKKESRGIPRIVWEIQSAIWLDSY